MTDAGAAPARPCEFEALEAVFGSGKAFEASTREFHALLEARGVYFGSGLLPTYLHAFVATGERTRRWASHAERFVEVMESVASQLVSDDEFGASLGLDAEAMALVRIDPG